jgi:hypothetical protein
MAQQEVKLDRFSYSKWAGDSYWEAAHDSYRYVCMAWPSPSRKHTKSLLPSLLATLRLQVSNHGPRALGLWFWFYPPAAAWCRFGELGLEAPVAPLKNSASMCGVSFLEVFWKAIKKNYISLQRLTYKLCYSSFATESLFCRRILRGYLGTLFQL